MSGSLSLGRLLKRGAYRDTPRNIDEKIKELQLKMLRVQQGVFHGRRRAIIALEGFDAAGKGGAIRRITEKLDPRSIVVHPIGPPEPVEQGRHWLYRFWTKLPAPGMVAVFDRSWYGRVLVERVERLTPKQRWIQAYDEINEFEALLIRDGIDVIKIFLAVSKDEQMRRFRERLENPFKQWKLTPADIEARRKWGEYVKAVDDAFACTDAKKCPWHLIPADNKEAARFEVLRAVTERLSHHSLWMEKKALEDQRRSVKAALKALGIRR